MKAIFSIFVIIFSSTFAYAESITPTKVISDIVAEIRKTVADHPATETDEALTAKLEKLIEPIFNFDDMAKRCLGTHWSSGTAQEQQEFVRLFSDLLADTYLGRIKKITKTEIAFQNETVKGDRAIVRSQVTDEGQVFPIDYRMIKANDHWRVYDVVIENISLVSNYRSEFSSIIRKEKFAGLITRLRDKRIETEAPAA